VEIATVKERGRREKERMKERGREGIKDREREE